MLHLSEFIWMQILRSKQFHFDISGPLNLFQITIQLCLFGGQQLHLSCLLYYTWVVKKKSSQTPDPSEAATVGI